MAFLKKYPVFVSLLVVLLLAFVAEIFVFFNLSARTAAARKATENSGKTLEHYLNLSPAPTAENLELAEENVADLREELGRRIGKVRGQIQSSVGENTPASPSDLLFELQGFVDRYTTRARSAREDGQAIRLPANFGFGFRDLLDSGVPPSESLIPGLWKQKEIMQYLLDALYSSDPISISTIEREQFAEEVVPEEAPRTVSGRRTTRTTVRTGPQGIFTINPLISARVPGAIDTLAFRVQFTGYTSTLRRFLAQLAEFKLPIVVRSVEVNLSQEKPEQRQGDDLGGIFGSPQKQPAVTEDNRSRRPVVVDNVSQFTVVVEFIQVVLETSDENGNSDSAGTAEAFDF